MTHEMLYWITRLDAINGVVQQRTIYSKKFKTSAGKEFKAVAIASRNGDIKEAFTIYAND